MFKGDDFLEFKKNLEKRIKIQCDLLFDEKKSDVVFSNAKQFLDENGKEFVAKLFEDSKEYDSLLSSLNIINDYGEETKSGFEKGVIALNGTSGVGQSYVMKFIDKELKNRGVSYERICLLATRSPRSNESHKNPYVFVSKDDNLYHCIHSGKVFSQDDVYLEYESRPGASNVILKKDLEKSSNKLMYLETVIPTLLKMKQKNIGGFNALGENLRIVYLAADSGEEWVYRLVSREPDKLLCGDFRDKLSGRVDSSLKDMNLAAKEQIPSVVHVLDYGSVTAKKVLAGWDIL